MTGKPWQQKLNFVTRSRHRLLTACVLLTLAAAQLFGLPRGYLCDCGGIAQLTGMDHCHGPHSAACHEHEDPCHKAEDHHGEEHLHDHDTDTHEHEPVIESLLAQAAGSSSSIAPPALDWVAVLPAWLGTPVIVSSSPPGRPPAQANAPPRSRSWPAILAHRIVLRV